MNENEQKEAIKMQNTLSFGQSDVWDCVHSIIEKVLQQEVNAAISQSLDEQKRSHQCGRAEAVLYVKDLLNSTRDEALKLSRRK